MIVASSRLLAAAPGLPAAWTRARRTALQEIHRDSAAYYAFHAEVSGFPLEVVKVSHPLSQFPAAAYPPEGLALLDEVKKFLLAENLVNRDFALVQWRVNDA